MKDQNHGHGGSYVTTENGTRELVDRTETAAGQAGHQAEEIKSPKGRKSAKDTPAAPETTSNKDS